MAYSAGFTPHPKVSYANAAPTGAASEAEYLEISLAEERDPEELRAALDTALPPGLDVVQVVPAAPGALADRLTGSRWEIVLPDTDPRAVAGAVEQFLARETVEVERLTKTGRRALDARSAVLRLEVLTADQGAGAESDLGRAAMAGGGPCAILHMVVRHTTPAVRPDDVLTALRAVADLAPVSPPQVTRLSQGLLDEVEGTVADPLATARDAADA
jgi:radical SAM-linked protein